MKKFKFLISAFLCMVIMTVLCPVYGDEVETEAAVEENTVKISTAEDFMIFAENCVLDTYSYGLNVSLEKDIDLGGQKFGGIGWFQGTFDGKGHTISGVKIERNGVNTGLFRTIGEGGIVKNLHIEGDIIAGETAANVGGIAGINYGAILECSFSGDIKGLTCLGGIAGFNSEQGTITSCTFGGSIQGEHQVGGIAGENQGTIAISANSGNVNIEAVSNTSDTEGNKLTEIVDGIAKVTTEDVLDITDIGGIAGLSKGTIYDCQSTGTVGYKHIGYNVGGICGRSSGYIALCNAGGDVYGKNDVGGICGQVEPCAKWNLSESNIVKLKEEFGVLESSVNELKNNISTTTVEVSNSVNSLISSAERAKRAFTEIIAGTATRSEDTVASIRTTITNIGNEDIKEELENIIQQIKSIPPDTSELTSAIYDTEAAADMLRNSLSAGSEIYANVSSISDTVSNIINIGVYTVENLGISEDYLRDVSVANAYTDNQGALDGCNSSANVYGDTGIGGVCGTTNFEISFDLEDELGISGYLFGNAKYEIFACIRDCSYNGNIEVKKASGGGILGKECYGLVINSKAVCQIKSEADYIGGIGGYSDATIMNSYARANLTGDSYVGGIVGLGCNISGCVAYSFIDEGLEIIGGICGSASGTVENNYYVSEGYGGIDGVDFYGKAEEITFAQMCENEAVPEEFKKIEVTFVKEGEIVSKIPVEYGGNISDAPEVAPEDGRYWVWDDFEKENIRNSFTVEGSWKNNRVTIATEGDQPEFLAEGSFGENQELVVSQRDSDNGTIYEIIITDFEGEALIRMKGTGVLVLQNGCELEVSEDGSYSVFTANVPGEIEVRAKEQPKTWIIWAAAGAVIVILILIFVIVKKRKKK